MTLEVSVSSDSEERLGRSAVAHEAAGSGRAAAPRSRADMVVFDVDGTLCDSMQAIYAAVNEMGPRLGFAPISEARYRQLRGMSIRQIQQALGLSTWKLLRLSRHVRSALLRRAAAMQPFPGVLEQVRSLHQAGYRLAIVSSNQRANIELFLRAHGLDGFEEIITHHGWGLGLARKGRQLAGLMARHAHDVRRFVYVGDELRDVEAARAAGMPVVAVSWGANSAETLAAAGPTALIHSAAELCGAVRQVLSREPAVATDG